MIFTYRDLGFHGRLGNQLWQIASTIGIAEMHGGTAIFDPDWKYRKYFNVPDRFFGEVPLDAVESWTFANSIHHAHRPYMQDLKLWKLIEPDIWDWFSPSRNGTQPGKTVSTRLTGIHVRRTDAVVKSDLFKVPDMTYFYTAMEALASETDVYLVFTDDQDWCERNFVADFGSCAVRILTPSLPEPTRNYKGDPEGNPYEMGDFWSLRACDNHITSNSTFSWWAAWLSNNPSPIAPKQWFNGRFRNEIDLDNFIPPSWRRM